MSLIGICLLLLACAGSKADDTAGGADSGEPAAAEAVSTWFFGISRGYPPNRDNLGSRDELLVIRTLDPVASTVHEEIWAVSNPNEVIASKSLHFVDIASQTFSADFVTADGTMEVLGAFDGGEDWAWTTWHSTSTFVDGRHVGTSVSSTDTLDPATGVVHADKLVYDADGVNIYVFSETLTPVDQATFEARLAEEGG